MQDEIGNRNFKAAIANPERFVLKPQREGGGNNVYGEDIKPFLENIESSQERNAYILMDRIQPPVTKNYMVSPCWWTSSLSWASLATSWGTRTGSSPTSKWATCSGPSSAMSMKGAWLLDWGPWTQSILYLLKAVVSIIKMFVHSKLNFKNSMKLCRSRGGFNAV